MPEIEEGANTSTNASPRPSCLTPQALADSMMNSMMESVKASVSKLRSGDPPTIYIVPQRIRQVNEVAYEPQMVSIGPYHHGKERLHRMEENKLLYSHSFLSRNPDHRLEDYLKAMEELEDKARSCYSDNIGPQVGNEFVKMMVLDACFILELFVRFFLLTQKEKDLVLPSENKFFLHSNDFKDPIRHTIVMPRLHLIGKEEGMSVNPTFNVSVIFGKRDEPMLVACARQLIEHISSCGSSRPLVLSLGLKDHSLETLKGIVSVVIENRLCSFRASTVMHGEFNGHRLLLETAVWVCCFQHKHPSGHGLFNSTIGSKPWCKNHTDHMILTL